MDAHAHHKHDHGMHMDPMETSTTKHEHHVTGSVPYHVMNTTIIDHAHHGHDVIDEPHIHHETHLNHHDNTHVHHHDNTPANVAGHNHQEHHHAHAMTFHTRNDDYILFEDWQLSPGKVTFFVCLGLVVVAIIYQAIKMARTRAGRKCPNTNCKRYILSRGHLMQTAFYVVQLLVGYLLMLAVMTYNVWVMVAAVVGLGLGYFFFGWAEYEEIVRHQPITLKRYSARSHPIECGHPAGEELLPLSKDTTSTDISHLAGNVACSCEDGV